MEGKKGIMAKGTKERNRAMRKYFKEERTKAIPSWQIMWDLADKYELESKTIEDIVYRKRKTNRRK